MKNISQLLYDFLDTVYNCFILQSINNANAKLPGRPATQDTGTLYKNQQDKEALSSNAIAPCPWRFSAEANERIKASCSSLLRCDPQAVCHVVGYSTRIKRRRRV